mgnify:FL=1
MRFTQDEIDAAVQEFKAEAKTRVVPAAGYNKDITIYGAENGPVQNPSDGDNGVAEPGTE